MNHTEKKSGGLNTERNLSFSMVLGQENDMILSQLILWKKMSDYANRI